MSLPRAILPLVIEDEPEAKEYYEEVFEQLREKNVFSPIFAFCHSDATEQLAADRGFHLVILDLRLPEHPNRPAAETLDFGLTLLQKCLEREEFPIPALLVISGNLQQARQRELTDLVQGGFAYGRVLVKSEDLIGDIRGAVEYIQSYCDVGIHLRDSGDKVFPTLSPRDEDLIRRCVLAEGCVGADVSWWSAERSPWDGWTKVLIGRFVLDQGMGRSLYMFFKMATSDGAAAVSREAGVMKQKLSHIKVIYSNASGARSILVTQAVGSGANQPFSLDSVFSRSHDDAKEVLSQAVSTIVGQVASLGDSTPDQRTMGGLLWDHHDFDGLEEQWNRRGGEVVLSQLKEQGFDCPDPMDVLKKIQASSDHIRYRRQSFRHGDLNYTNIALEENRSGAVDAFIFDASGTKSGASVRDLAMLEVTTLLHQMSTDEDSIVEKCRVLYDGSYEEGCGVYSDQIANIICFVNAIRRNAASIDEIKVYALLVFDNALIQLGGLGFGSSFNKIHLPSDAVLLVALSGAWFLRMSDAV